MRMRTKNMKRAMLLLMALLFSFTEAHSLWTYFIKKTETIGPITYNVWYRKYSGFAESRAQQEPLPGVGDVTQEYFDHMEVTAKADYPYHYQGYIDIPSTVEGYGAVTSIAGGAFKDCGAALVRVDIPASVYVKSGAFTNCIGLSEVHTACERNIADDAFDEYIYEHATLFVPKGRKAVYEGLGGWKNFKIINDGSEDDELQEGDTFTAKTAEGVDVTYTVKDTNRRRIYIGRVYYGVPDPAIDSTYAGEVTIPEEVNGYEVAGLESGAFYLCKKVTHIHLPAMVENIGAGAFAQCQDLMNVNIPNGVKTIGEEAFTECTSLTSVSIPEGVTAISDYTFYCCSSLKDVSLPTTINTIGRSAFNGCESLKSISIPNGVTTIGIFAFNGCTNLRTVLLPNTLKEIGAATFSMSGLLSINLPSSLEKIGTQAFYGCSNLKALTIPYKVETLGEVIVGYCNDLKSLTVDSSNPYFRSSGNGIIDKSTNMLIHSCPATVIPTDIVGISRLGFACVPGVEEIIIPENIRTLGAGAFEECFNLKRVTIPATIESIAEEAFLQCESLEQVTMLNPIPVAITDNVFHMNETQNSDNTGYTTSDFTTATLYVPYGSKAAYQQTAGWKNFQNIVEMEAPAEPELVMTEMNIEGDGIVGTLHTYTIYIDNRGQGDFVGSAYVWAKESNWSNPLRMGWASGTIKAGKSVSFEYVNNVDDGEKDYFFFTSPGTYHFWLTTDAEGQQRIEGEKVFVVTPAATLTAKSYTREYGEENPDFGFTADKGGFSGTPKITCTADRYSDVGTYDIVIEQGSVDNNYVTLVPGTLTITKAPLTVSAGSWLNREGWEPAGITPKYENFKNGQDKSVLTREPQFTTTATASSPMGSVHQLTFSGAEAKNYLFNYIPGTITIIGRPGDVNRDSYVNTTDAVDVIQATLGYNSLQDIFDGDLYRDNEITLADVASVIDYIMADDRVAARRSAPITETNSLLSLTLDEQGRLAVMLQNDMPFIGVQFDVTLPGDADLSQMLLSDHRRNGHSVAMRHMDDGSYRVLVYSMQNTALRGSDGMLATLLTSAIDGDVALSNIHVVDEQCADHRLPDVSLSMLTGISTLTEDTAPFDIYDLNGRLVRRNATSTKGLHRGVYMINSQKVIIK